MHASVPISVLFGEAADVANFVANYGEPKREGDKVVLPGLTSANRTRGKLTFGAESATDLLSLMVTAQAASTSYNLKVAPGAATDAREGARGDLSELQGALELLFDDGIENEHDQQLAQLDDTHKDLTNDDGLATACADYAGLARQADVYAELTELAAQGGFELAVVARCEQHANSLRLLPAAPRPKDPDALAAFELRNRLVNLLQQRVRLVRAAARWVFRDFPAVARQASSAYERRRRAEARRKQKAASDQPK